MIARIFAANRPHYTAITHLVSRDLPLQIASGIAICAVCLWVGRGTWVWPILAWIVISELCLVRIVKRRAPFDQWTKDQILLGAMVLSSINVMVYLSPSLLLASEPSVAMKVTALLWSLGTLIYITNTFSRVPSFLYSMLVPAYVIIVLSFFRLGSTPPTKASVEEWAVTLLFMILLIFTSIDSLREHIRAQTDLRMAELESSRRMARLTETQRVDPLTGLLNRPAFDRSLTVMLSDRQIVGGEIAVLLVDLDSFKPINDAYSHEAGDRVLQATARRLQMGIGDQGIVGRMGGDEFVCAIPDLADEAEALALARRLVADISNPIAWGDRQLKIGASIGVAMTGAHPAAPSATVSELCSAADQAMFAAKSSPNYAPVLYEAHLFAPRLSSDEKRALVDAVSNRALRPFYQPKVHLPTGRIIGFEALARWKHPDGRLRSPAEFVDQVNELGLQGDFMLGMAEQVMRDITAMRDAGLDPGQVSINIPEVALATLSGRQDLQRVVAAYPKATGHLTFEITEDVFIARAAEAIQASISVFRSLGIRVSLDDFGTGFASFHHLRQLDFDELKIDTSFVAGLGHDNTAEVLVQGFLNIASGIGVSVIAEGVETEDQRRDLINMGCMTAQGYLFSDAVPIEEATQLLSEQQAA